MPLASGTRLGPYQVVSLIGAGGMGEVYKAADTRLGRTVAIKVLPQHLASDPERLAPFRREAQTISSLNHPHICALHDVGDEHGKYFLVMEYVEGETLDDRITMGPLRLDDALEYARQIADALNAAHDHGIVHRDLKLGNVMILPDHPRGRRDAASRSSGRLLPRGREGTVPMALMSGDQVPAPPSSHRPAGRRSGR